MSDALTPTQSSKLQEAIQLYIRNRFVGIFQHKGDDDPVYIGSGVTVEIGEKIFIATAAHNFQDVPSGGKFTLFSASSGKLLFNTAANLSEYGTRGTLDLAWLELDPTSAKEADLFGVPLDAIDPRHRFKKNGLYWITGFPWESSRMTQAQGVTDYNFPLLIYLTSPVTKGKAVASEVLLEYLPDAMTHSGPATMPHPRGMSGGAIWYVPAHELSGVWTPTRYQLTGVLIEYFKAPHYKTKGLKMQVWLEFLLDDRPDLREYIEPVLKQT